MAKYRIVQTKPAGLVNSFEVQEQIHITQEINPIYRANQSYWEGTFRYNAGGRPRDWFIKVDKYLWQRAGEHSSLANAEYQVLALQDKLEKFDRVVIKEYD